MPASPAVSRGAVSIQHQISGETKQEFGVGWKPGWFPTPAETHLTSTPTPALYLEPGGKAAATSLD